MPPVVSDLTVHLGYWLRLVSNHVSHAFARKLAANDVTVAEWVLLRALFRKKPMPPSELADAMGLSRGAVTKLADRLIGKALLVREASSKDGRSQTLSLTTKASRFVPKLAALADQNDAECFEHLSQAERHALKRILGRMVNRFGLTSMPVD